MILNAAMFFEKILLLFKSSDEKGLNLNHNTLNVLPNRWSVLWFKYKNNIGTKWPRDEKPCLFVIKSKI